MTGAVLFMEDVCRELGMSMRTMHRLRRYRAFPIPELAQIALPGKRYRPRWSRAAVDAYLASRHEPTVARRSSLRACKAVAGVGR